MIVFNKGEKICIEINQNGKIKRLYTCVSNIKKKTKENAIVTINNTTYNGKIKKYYTFNCNSTYKILYIEEEFYKQFYLLDSKTDVHEHYCKIGILNGLICNKFQILKHYPNTQFDTKNRLIHFQSNVYSLHDFTNQFMNINEIERTCFNVISDLFNKNKDIFIIITSSNDDICLSILNDLESILKNQNICLCYTVGISHTKSINHLKKITASTIICTCTDMGSDIIPFKIAYNYIRYKYNFCKYVLKLHTKNCVAWRTNMIKPFLNIESYLKQLKSNSKYFGVAAVIFQCDEYNKEYIESFFPIQSNFKFAAGTIFLHTVQDMTRIIQHPAFYNIYKNSLRVGMYYDNISFIEGSPIHSLERLFGYIPYSYGKTYLQITN